MFVDAVKIQVKGGKGGNGCVSFRRERFLPRGGPNGGDGGNGGNIKLQANPQLHSLDYFRYKRHFAAKNGGPGLGQKQHGHHGNDLVLELPLGTIVKDEAGSIVLDICSPEIEQIIAGGGRGGKGNARYVSSTNQAPRNFTEGQEGQEGTFELELKLIADVGLVGYPNAGKSTYLRAVSNAKPKIGDYPFTTLHPHIGIVSFEDFFRMTIADIPGIMEGAHKNIGLGHAFLKHIERTKILVYVLDMAPAPEKKPWEILESLQRELEEYSANLTKRSSIIIANKMDIPGAEKNLALLQKNTTLEIFPLSAASGEKPVDSLQRMRFLLEKNPLV